MNIKLLLISILILHVFIAKAGLTIRVSCSWNGSDGAAWARVNNEDPANGFTGIGWGSSYEVTYAKDSYVPVDGSGNVSITLKNFTYRCFWTNHYAENTRTYSKAQWEASYSVSGGWFSGDPSMIFSYKDCITNPSTSYSYSISFYHWPDEITFDTYYGKTGSTLYSAALTICENDSMNFKFKSRNNTNCEWKIDGVSNTSGTSLNHNFVSDPAKTYRIEARGIFRPYYTNQYSAWCTTYVKIAHSTITKIIPDLETICNDSTTGALKSITVTGGTGPFKILGQGGPNNDPLKYVLFYGNTVSLEGYEFYQKMVYGTNYNLVIRDSGNYNCPSFQPFTLKKYLPITATITKSDITNPCYDDRNGSISINSIVGGGEGPFTYLYSNGESSISGNNIQINKLYNQAATSLSITSIKGCTNSLSLPSITGGPYNKLQKPSMYIVDTVDCHNYYTGKIVANVQGGYGKYRFYLDTLNNNTGLWSTYLSMPGVATVYSNGDCDFSNIPSRTYRLRAVDNVPDPGCNVEASTTLFMPHPTAVVASANVIDSIDCHGQKNGTIEVKATGGTIKNLGYNFYLDSVQIDSLSTAQNKIPFFTNKKSRNYNFMVQDNHNCPGFGSIFVGEPDPLIVNFNKTPVSCVGTPTGSIQAIISGGNLPYEFEWYDEFETTPLCSSLFLKDKPKGIYYFHYKDKKNCQNYAAQIMESVAQNVEESATALKLEIAKQDIRCKNENNGVITLTGMGGTSPYMFSSDGVNFSLKNEYSQLLPNTYKYWVKDGTGCEYSDLVQVIEPDELTATAEIEDVKCKGEKTGYISVNTVGGTKPYNYSIASENIVQNDSLLGPFYAMENNYTLLVKDINDCATTIYPTISEPESKLEVSVNKIQDTYCSDPTGEAIGLVSGGTPFQTGVSYLYQWSDLDQQTDALATGLQAGTFFLKATDSNNCFDSASVEIFNLDGPNASLDTAIQPNCFDEESGFLSLNVSGGTMPYSAQWSVSIDGQWDNFEGSVLEAQNLKAGLYRAIVADAELCQYEFQYILLQPEALEATIEKQDPTCYNNIDGFASGSASGGTSPYTYLWIDPNNRIYDTETVQELGYGSLSLIVSDSHNCSDDANVELINPVPIELDLPDTVLLCTGQSKDLDPGDFRTYTWSKEGQLLNDERILNVEQQGNYTISIKDDKGCQSAKTIFVSVRNDLLNAKFLMKDTAFVNDTIAIVDVSYPIPENITWMIPTEITEIGMDENPKQLYLTQAGIYRITLNAFLYGCVDEVGSEITVLEKSSDDHNYKKYGFVPIKDVVVFPNPSNGIFEVDVVLEEEGEIQMVMTQSNSSMLPDSYKKSSGSDKYSIHYDITNLPAGAYSILIKTNGDQRTIKMVKQ